MQGRRDQMRGSFTGKLNYVLPQVGFEDIHPHRLQDRVEGKLFRHHRLAFGDHLDAPGLGYPGHDCVGLGGVGGEMHLPARFGHVLLQQVKVVVQVVQGVGLDSPGILPPLLPPLGRNFLDGVAAGTVEAGPHFHQGPAQNGIENRRLRRSKEILGFYIGHGRLS